MTAHPKEAVALKIIDTWLDYRSRYSFLPGFQLCLRDKGKVIFNKAYGNANLKTQRALTEKDLFHVASHSKSFTSCVALQQIQKGRLAFHDPIVQYIPELRHHKDKRFKTITVRDLLSNRAGIFRDGLDAEFWQLTEPFLSREELLKEMGGSNLVYSPNKYTKYSNIGFSLMGLVLEKVFGKPYTHIMEDFLAQNLKSTSILPDYPENAKVSFADGHSRLYFEGKRLPVIHRPTRAMAPATGFCATAEDITLFFDELLRANKFLKPEMHRELLNLSWPVKDEPGERYGLGLQFTDFDGTELIGHAGGYPGFASKTVYWKGTDYTMSFLLNTNEFIPLMALKSAAKIIKTTLDLFKGGERASVSVSKPLMNKGAALLFALSKKTGLIMTLEGWSPYEAFAVLKSKDGETYTCDPQSGYESPGEPITFKRDKQGNILSAQWGGFAYIPEDDLLKSFKGCLLG